MSLVFVLKSNNDNTKIKKININDIKNDIKKNNSYFSEKKELYQNTINKNKKYLYDATRFFSMSTKNYGVEAILNILNISNYYEFDITKNNILKNDKILNNSKSINTFYIKKINEVRNKAYLKNEININQLAIIYYHIIIDFIKSNIKKFKNNDNFIFAKYQFGIENELIVNLLYLLSLLFDKIIFINDSLIFCIGYNENNKYVDTILKLDKNSYLSIEPKEHLEQLKKYSKNIINNKKKLLDLAKKKDEVKLFKELYELFASYCHDPFILEHDRDHLLYKYFQLHLIENSRRFFIKDKNESTEVKIHSAIKKDEGKNIQKIIRKYKFKKCLEIGMAFGISASYILLSNKNVSLMSIDPYQKDKNQWNSMGLKLIKELELDERHHYIPEKSYISMPKLLSTYGEEYFDFIFIDGWHTFDYTLIDFFYADRLLRIGGVILIDDALHKGVQKFIKYIESNYKNYEKIETIKTQCGYIKISHDDREWFYHQDF
jgi:predicted O-methyltransferase YrrM